MRKKFWSFDNVVLNIDDRTATVIAIHIVTCTEVKIHLRLKEDQMDCSVSELRKRAEVTAADYVQDFASFLDVWGME